jgi:hypothetical protein
MSEWPKKIVAIGLPTNRDLDTLGAGFRNHFPVIDDDLFADLLTRLDAIEIEPLCKDVVLKPKH